ncbi:MAG: C69 family dipeptidase, partial [Candidatus Aminicenantes bacterium]|nr:C69 family dipeptidase [Candidatus Aminicenantes bacterium]
MKLKKQHVMSVLLAVLLILIGASVFSGPQEKKCETCTIDLSQEACTVIMVGKNASTDGSVMTTHTCDCGLCDWTFRYVPAADHKPGEMRRIYHIDQFGTIPPDTGLKWDRVKDNFAGLEILEVSHTYGYIHGAFGYMNDLQVSIGESTIGCQKKMENQTPTPKFDITMLTL